MQDHQDPPDTENHKRRTNGPSDPPVPDVVREWAVARLKLLLEEQASRAKLAARENGDAKPGSGDVWRAYGALCEETIAWLAPSTLSKKEILMRARKVCCDCDQEIGEDNTCGCPGLRGT